MIAMSVSKAWYLKFILSIVFACVMAGNLPTYDEKMSRASEQVAFSVMLSENKTVDTANTPFTVPFDQIVTNVGNWFNLVSSHFTVPMDGPYFFSFNFMSGYSKFADVRLSVNAVHKLSAVAYRGGILGSNQGVFNLKQGDSVALELQPHGLIDNRDLLACFSGHYVNTTSAFTVARTANFTGFRVIPFDNIITNIGNGYDSSSHSYRVSIPGIYFFTFKSIGSAQNYNHNCLLLSVNNTGVVNSVTPDPPTTGQNFVILSLSSGDFISVSMSSCGSIMSDPSNQISNATFSGFLLFHINAGKNSVSQEAKAGDKIAFSVGRTSGMASSTSAVRLMFDKEFVNEGLGFDFAGSYFEAPVDGIYVFFIHGVRPHDLTNDMLVYLIHNSQMITKVAAMYGSKTWRFSTATNHVIIRLLASDSVWLDLQPNSTIFSSTQPHISTTFSGYLVHSLN